MATYVNRFVIHFAARPSRLARTMRPALLVALLLSTTATAISLTNVASRKDHAVAGTFDLPIAATPSANGGVTVEPRAIGAGHLIIFTFDEAVTSPGMATAVDAGNALIGKVSAPVMMGNEVHVTIADVPDRRQVKVSLMGVTGASGMTNASATMGFLIGDFNDSGAVTSPDGSAGKARAGRAVDAGSFRFDINASGVVSAADIAATKSRVGLSMATGSLPLKWHQGGWDLDVWQ